jgi:hypothetical protein
MANSKRVRVTSNIYGEKRPSVLEKMIPEQTEQESELEQPMQEDNSEQKPKGRILKQAMFSIGTARELKLDEIALAYNKQKGTRIGRNDIIRYLIDTLNLDEVLRVDLQTYKR